MRGLQDTQAELLVLMPCGQEQCLHHQGGAVTPQCFGTLHGRLIINGHVLFP